MVTFSPNEVLSSSVFTRHSRTQAKWTTSGVPHPFTDTRMGPVFILRYFLPTTKPKWYHMQFNNLHRYLHQSILSWIRLFPLRYRGVISPFTCSKGLIIKKPLIHSLTMYDVLLPLSNQPVLLTFEQRRLNGNDGSYRNACTEFSTSRR